MKESLLYILIGLGIGILFVFLKKKFKVGKVVMPFREPDRGFPYQWRRILDDKIEFYRRLTRTEKERFEYKVHVFLLNVRVTGIDTEITDEDRVLIAASATIPIFGFPNWHYLRLKEVVIHPDKFNIPNSDAMARGLVGWGSMEGKVLLSKKALHEGYNDQNDQVNVALHEFIHILDKQDGKVDGVLGKVMKEVDIMPWLYVIKQKMNEIEKGNSSIRDYGKANQAEFLAVVGEFFFENPDKMREEHPILYSALDGMFNPTKQRKRGSYSR